MSALTVLQPPPLDAVRRIAAFMANFSIEATRPTDTDIAALAVLPRGTRVYLSAVPGRPAAETVAAAIRLRAAGFEPLPHLAVRNFLSVDALDDFLARLNAEADVRRVLVIAGDRAACGPFRCASDAIDSGILRRRGMRAIGIAGYPEGHPRVSDAELGRALSAKIAAAEAIGLSVEIVTQFSFAAHAILAYVARLRAFGFEQPVRIGLAGPTSLPTLVRYTQRCGVRASAPALAQRCGLVRRMFAMTAPDDLVRTLANAAPANVSVHLFSFGRSPASARWARAVAEGNIELEGPSGFRVAPQRHVV